VGLLRVLADGDGDGVDVRESADALAEVDSDAGLQVHRGWWVANGAVAGTFMRGGKRWLRLNNDMEIPVSRTHLRRVIDQAWPRVDEPARGSSSGRSVA
jgi:DNA-binding LytR/AlgR family response regulator